MRNSVSSESAPTTAVAASHMQTVASRDHHAYVASTQQQSSPEAFWIRATTDPVAAFTGILAVATIILFIFTGGLWWVTYRLSKDAKISAGDQAEKMGTAVAEAKSANDIAREAMQADQRAWLSIKAAFASGFRAGQTQYGVDGFYIDLAGLVVNHGRSPAMHVRLNAEIILLNPERNMEDQLRDFCDDWRVRHNRTGPALFAGQDMPVAHCLFLPQRDIDEAVADIEFKVISPVVIGCVSYETPHANGVRQTRFAYYVAAVKEGRFFAMMPAEPAWWEGEVRLTDHETIYPD